MHKWRSIPINNAGDNRRPRGIACPRGGARKIVDKRNVVVFPENVSGCGNLRAKNSQANCIKVATRNIAYTIRREEISTKLFTA